MKKIICVLLALLMLAPSHVTAFASETESTGTEETNETVTSEETTEAVETIASEQTEAVTLQNYVEDVEISSNSAVVYRVTGGKYYNEVGTGCAVFTFTGSNYRLLDDYVAVAYPYGNTLGLNYYIADANHIVFTTNTYNQNVGSQVVAIRLVDVNGFYKDFSVSITAINLRQKTDDYVLLAKNKSEKLELEYQTVTNGGWITVPSHMVQYASSDSAVAKVNAFGKVKAKSKAKTCYVTGTFATSTFYWAVNVTSKDKVKVIETAVDIYQTSKYSQPRRMQNGYYDCSSLVWRAYKTVGVRFGVSSSYHYAPVAATEAKYLVSKGKQVKGGIKQNNTVKGKLVAGDLLFRGGHNNGRYRGVDHVEMFTGYSISYIKSNGTPVYANNWASKPEGYYGYGSSGDFVCRP
ncbi:MAG: C40 family peptidase [Lachnospiraceae bacterium]|nr:C40 family peptidase [Lachnospiraceae bacterium]